MSNPRASSAAYVDHREDCDACSPCSCVKPAAARDTSRRLRIVKARAQIEIVVAFEDDFLDYGGVHQAVQDAIGHTGAIVIDVDEYEERPNV